MEQEKSCIKCKHLEDCPIILAWVEATEAPMEILTFSCSEYLKEMSFVEAEEGIR